MAAAEQKRPQETSISREPTEAAKDLEEWRRLRSLANRPNVLKSIDERIAHLECSEADFSERDEVKREVTQRAPPSSDEKSAPCNLSQPVKLTNRPSTSTQMHFLPLTSFAWNQTDRAVKIYVRIQGVQDIPEKQVVAKFARQSMELEVHDLSGKNYSLVFKRLNNVIVPETCSYRIKKDMVVVTLQKSGGQWWSDISFKENKFAAPPKLEQDADPSASIMSLMKNLYEEGDDEMKRTIAKSWMESQQQRMSGNSPFGDMNEL
ncbi:SGS domain-containing protein [Toxoplasma gondii RUB]|uniref:SGS domain-containing protein n=5 Tax=Toxoplasma gondii TaxID=5811 RepID=A0A086LRN2_TOXGO|nr:SGS domain-containing protein [Toxoplasma gondii p89]KFG59300.1 SGS domain-containing protein [Toxoplasma gondii RUB]KFH02656.1 SGS domain-containing protein [Toxoplasma gondii VAND]KFH09367.1 SGS domain-containing protein [Toxoplasma gondii MAS]PUA86028.1 SGS domain-containing protein [Toxoplasma gondii TgCATBr9]